MQVLVTLAFARNTFAAVGFVGDLVEHAIGVGDAGEGERNFAKPNRLDGGDVTPVNPCQKPLASWRHREGARSVGWVVHRSRG